MVNGKWLMGGKTPHLNPLPQGARSPAEGRVVAGRKEISPHLRQGSAVPTTAGWAWESTPTEGGGHAKSKDYKTNPNLTGLKTGQNRNFTEEYCKIAFVVCRDSLHSSNENEPKLNPSVLLVN